jgi:hypothetical protein
MDIAKGIFRVDIQILVNIQAPERRSRLPPSSQFTLNMPYTLKHLQYSPPSHNKLVKGMPYINR